MRADITQVRLQKDVTTRARLAVVGRSGAGVDKMAVWKGFAAAVATCWRRNSAAARLLFAGQRTKLGPQFRTSQGGRCPLKPLRHGLQLPAGRRHACDKEMAAVKTLRMLVGLVVLSALAGTVDSQAVAQIGWWRAWPEGNPYLSAPYASSYGSIPTPPYFAIHPPVYYGPRIRMAYGYSPIARPPLAVVEASGTGGGKVVPATSGRTVCNTFVTTASAGAEPGTAVALPQLVSNPYCSPAEPEAPAEARVAARPGAPSASGSVGKDPR